MNAFGGNPGGGGSGISDRVETDWPERVLEEGSGVSTWGLKVAVTSGVGCGGWGKAGEDWELLGGVECAGVSPPETELEPERACRKASSRPLMMSRKRWRM